jgi:hypothetical protein
VHKGRLETFNGGVIAVIITIGLLAGCAGEPPRFPATTSTVSAAVVRAWSPTPADGEVRITAVDGIEVGKVSHVYLSPGEHEIRLRWSGPQAVTRDGAVRAVVQSRSTYLIEAEPDGALRTVRFSLVDKGADYDEQCLEQPMFGSEPKGRAC